MRELRKCPECGVVTAEPVVECVPDDRNELWSIAEQLEKLYERVKMLAGRGSDRG